jgi:hypothetical protein
VSLPISKTTAVLACLAFAYLAMPALAAAPLPQTAKAYSTGGYEHGLSFTLVTSAANPKRIEPGSATAGSQFALSNGAIQCKKAKRAPGVPEPPFAIFGFPGATLKLSAGMYGFAKTITQRETSVLGSTSTAKFTLKVKIVGTVVSPTRIEGTVKPTGGPCTAKSPIPFTANRDPKLPVAPSALARAAAAPTPRPGAYHKVWPGSTRSPSRSPADRTKVTGLSTTFNPAADCGLPTQQRET